MESAVKRDAKARMDKTIDFFKKELSKVRTGRASAAILDDVKVSYYGSTMSITQVATISVPEPKTILIQPWDAAAISAIEKAIQKAELGLNPNNDGKVVRLNIPPLNEERRRDIIKFVKKLAEENKVAIRNERRDAVEAIKAEEKTKSISEDESKKMQKDIQELTDSHVRKIDELVALKEKEIMEV